MKNNYACYVCVVVSIVSTHNVEVVALLKEGKYWRRAHVWRDQINGYYPDSYDLTLWSLLHACGLTYDLSSSQYTSAVWLILCRWKMCSSIFLYVQ